MEENSKLKYLSRGKIAHRALKSGGNWNNAANAGLFALNLNNERSNANTNIGFRFDFVICRILKIRFSNSAINIKGDFHLTKIVELFCCFKRLVTNYLDNIVLKYNENS